MLDFVFITHLPSFYKINLYNRLSQHYNVHVIFLGKGSTIRPSSFVSSSFEFEATFLSQHEFELRNRWQTSRQLIRVLKKLSYRKLCLGGWEHPEFWVAAFYSARLKNGLCLESGLESVQVGIKARIKQLFLSRMSTVLATGDAQVNLVKQLGFKKPIIKTHGVGILHTSEPSHSRAPGRRFLYVGRLAKEKDVELMFEAFRQKPDYHLTVVGEGDLTVPALKNIDYKGHVTPDALTKIYHDHHVLVLASRHEPWGLVVEEALYHGLQVVVSDKVAAKELIESPAQGCVFEAGNLRQLMESLDLMGRTSQESPFDARDSFERRTRKQLSAYEKALA